MKTALEIAAQIRNFEKTVTQTVEEHIAQIEKVNPRLNAVVEKRYEKALEEAGIKDEAFRKMSEGERQNLPPLFGVPYTCKEMISSAGMKSTMGSIHRKDRRMKENASVVQRIEDAGAILLGTTNVPEVGFWFECDNVLYGATKNPYDLTRTSGGSSGGEGSIIGSGASPFGIGSDIGGSIRLPAAFCGIFGHKPSDRLVPLTGHFPFYPDTASEIVGNKYPFTVMGPLARSAADLEILCKLMMGPDQIDPNVKSDFHLKPLIKQCEDLKVFFLPSPMIHATSETEEDITQSVRHAARYLKEMGSPAEEMDSKIFLSAVELWAARTWSVDSKSFTEFLSDDHPFHYGREIFKILIGKRQYTLPSILVSFAEKYATDRSEFESQILALGELKNRLTKQLGSNGVLLMPVNPRKAPKLGTTYTRPFDFAYTGIINALGFPATAVPMGLSKEGLPLSVQVVAAENQDHLCLSVARLLEIGFGGWKPSRLFS